MPAALSWGQLDALGSEALFDTMAVRFNAPRAAGLEATMAWTFEDRNEHWRLELSHGALHAWRVDAAAPADVTLRLSRDTLHRVLRGSIGAADAVATGQVRVTGDAGLFTRFVDLLDAFTLNFAVVEAAPWPDR